MFDMKIWIVRLLLTLPAVLWAISFHEFCHGWVAYKLGDPTAKMSGRLTLNPFAHFDLIGGLMLLLVHFGWAKPVPIDPRYFRRPQRDMILVSLAGVAGNILTAVVCGLIIRVLPFIHLALVNNFAVYMLFQFMVLINLALAVFNLIPIPPLDGSKLFYSLVPKKWLSYYFWVERYGMFILMALVLSGVIRFIMMPPINFLYRLIMPGFMR